MYKLDQTSVQPNTALYGAPSRSAGIPLSPSMVHHLLPQGEFYQSKEIQNYICKQIKKNSPLKLNENQSEKNLGEIDFHYLYVTLTLRRLGLIDCFMFSTLSYTQHSASLTGSPLCGFFRQERIQSCLSGMFSTHLLNTNIYIYIKKKEFDSESI